MSERTLPILNGDGELVGDALAKMFAFMNYPEDLQSAFHFAEILNKDSRFQTEGLAEDWSRAAELLLNDLSGRKNQALVAGHVALAMVEMQANDKKVSLSRAIAFTDYFARKAKEEGAKLPVSKRKVREHWDNFKSVAHFWAADIAMPELYMKATRSEEGLNEFLALSEAIERIVGASIDPLQTEWNPWRVPAKFAVPESLIAVPPWNDEVKEFVDSYYQRKGN